MYRRLIILISIVIIILSAFCFRFTKGLVSDMSSTVFLDYLNAYPSSLPDNNAVIDFFRFFIYPGAYYWGYKIPCQNEIFRISFSFDDTRFTVYIGILDHFRWRIVMEDDFIWEKYTVIFYFYRNNYVCRIY